MTAGVPRLPPPLPGRCQCPRTAVSSPATGNTRRLRLWANESLPGYEPFACARGGRSSAPGWRHTCANHPTRRPERINRRRPASRKHGAGFPYRRRKRRWMIPGDTARFARPTRHGPRRRPGASARHPGARGPGDIQEFSSRHRGASGPRPSRRRPRGPDSSAPRHLGARPLSDGASSPSRRPRPGTVQGSRNDLSRGTRPP